MASSLKIRVLIERPGIAPLCWFSARLRFAILTDQRGLERYLDSVILLRATTRQIAFDRALENGRAREQSYRNEAGVAVRWRLAAIVSLDEVSEPTLNGAEILTIPMEADLQDLACFEFDHEFQPELSHPAETRA